MNYSPKSPNTTREGVREPLIGRDVPDIAQAGRGDLSDWIELMVAVETLCPLWPERERSMGGDYKL